VIWHSAKSVDNSGNAISVGAGKQIRLTATWNGRSNQGGPKRLAPGLYTVTASQGGNIATTTIEIIG
jgi:hypothetical protein